MIPTAEHDSVTAQEAGLTAAGASSAVARTRGASGCVPSVAARLRSWCGTAQSDPAYGALSETSAGDESTIKQLDTEFEQCQPEPEPEPETATETEPEPETESASMRLVGLIWCLVMPLLPSVWVTRVLCSEEFDQLELNCGDRSTTVLLVVSTIDMLLPIALFCEAVRGRGSSQRSRLRTQLLTFLGFITFSVSLIGFVLIHAAGWANFVVLLLTAALWAWSFAWAMFSLRLGGRLDFDVDEHRRVRVERGPSIAKENKDVPIVDGAAVNRAHHHGLMAIVFITMLYFFQTEHFDVESQHAVHSSLRQDLNIHIMKEDGEEHFGGIMDADSLFRWLEFKLLPGLTNKPSHSGAAMPSVTRNSTQCREDVVNPPWWHAQTSRSIEDARRDCETCDGVQAPLVADELTFAGNYELLYQGVLIRQVPHCAFASIKGVGGEVFRRHTGAKYCKKSNLFDIAAAKIFSEDSLVDGNGTDSKAGRMPGYGCFTFDLQKLRDNPRIPADQRKWIDRTRMSKREIFLPTSNSLAALEAAKQVLRKAKDSQWVDPSTATVEVIFLIMSLEYGMLTQVKLSIDFQLGGYVETSFTMHSAMPNIFDPRSLIYRIGHENSTVFLDGLFYVILLLRVWIEIRRCVRAWFFDPQRDSPAELYTAVMPHALGKAVDKCSCRRIRHCCQSADSQGQVLDWVPWRTEEIRSEERTTIASVHSLVFREIAGKNTAFAYRTTDPLSPIRTAVEDHGVLTEEGVDEAMAKLGAPFTDHQRTVAMKRFASSQTRDGQVAMSLSDFRAFYEDYCERAYLSDVWSLMALVLLVLHSVCAVCLYHINWPSPELTSLVLDSKHPMQWALNSTKWTAAEMQLDHGQQYEQVMHDVTELMDFKHRLRYLCATMLLLQMLMLLQYLVNFDPKLAILTETIAFVGIELLYFLSVFLLVIGAYALAGQFLYGADLAEFNNFSSSAQACFALMLGSGDFARMQTVTHAGTVIFYWSWMLLGLLIIMNLMISILSVGHERATKVIYGENEVGYHPGPSLASKLLAKALDFSPIRVTNPMPETVNEETHVHRRDIAEGLAEIKLLVEQLHLDKSLSPTNMQRQAGQDPQLKGPSVVAYSTTSPSTPGQKLTLVPHGNSTHSESTDHSSAMEGQESQESPDDALDTSTEIGMQGRPRGKLVAELADLKAKQDQMYETMQAILVELAALRTQRPAT